MSPKQWFVKLVETQKGTSSLSGDYFFIPNTKHNLMSWWVELNQISSKISYQLCKIQITILLKFISMVSYFSCSPHTVWTVNDVTASRCHGGRAHEDTLATPNHINKEANLIFNGFFWGFPCDIIDGPNCMYELLGWKAVYFFHRIGW